ncbi:hypothetical protein F2Q65_13575 [Thiohalocapsa marina]|uniref:Uncharacterized protein n=1 Tax=Thiohalocapsa marina TaxID=424902 RepID=A0A5M8FHA4_9GAMM|nr:hypothetical protein [Thiohalocapsa marina]KAA6184097.1 hypothetical protein F2Q65_13575 [Thiohalocapsa marina]
MNHRYVRLAGLVALAMLLASQTAVAGNKKLMTVNAAKLVAERAIVESVIGIKVRSREQVDNLVAEGVSVDAKTAASIKGIEFTDIIYDPEKDIAQAEASIRLGRVSNIVGRNIDFGGQTIRRVGFATSTPAMAGPLQALRAAELDAYKQLAKIVVGFKLDSRSSVRDYILESDSVRARMMAAIYGAELVGYRWDEDGNAYVNMRLRFGAVQDVLKQRILYDNEVIEVEGVGAQIDDFNAPVEGFGAGEFKGRAAIREGVIDVPVGMPPMGVRPAEVPPGGGADLH